MISVYEEAHNETLGVALCACATVANALRTALSSHLLSGKLDVFSMTWYTGPVAAVVLLPVALYREFRCVSSFVRGRDRL
jgi:drug/metabolite transporter (DMT)-like permease